MGKKHPTLRRDTQTPCCFWEAGGREEVHCVKGPRSNGEGEKNSASTSAVSSWVVDCDWEEAHWTSVVPECWRKRHVWAWMSESVTVQEASFLIPCASYVQPLKTYILDCMDWLESKPLYYLWLMKEANIHWWSSYGHKETTAKLQEGILSFCSLLRSPQTKNYSSGITGGRQQ